MSNVVSNQNLQPTIGALTGALVSPTYDARESEQPVWPDRKPEPEKVDQPTQSLRYRMLEQTIEITAKQPDYTAFSRDMAKIYTSLSDRQERLGQELEAAIFDDLDNLYID